MRIRRKMTNDVVLRVMDVEGGNYGTRRGCRRQLPHDACVCRRTSIFAQTLSLVRAAAAPPRAASDIQAFEEKVDGEKKSSLSPLRT